MRHYGLTFLAALFLFLAAVPAQAAVHPWVARIYDYHAIDPVPGFTDPGKALGKPAGGGVYAPDQSHVYSIGRAGAGQGSFIVFGFEAAIEDHPDNPQGFDFIVFSNGFWVGGSAQRRWIEPALVQVSEDTNGNGLPDDPWYTIPGSRNLAASMLPQGIPDLSPPLSGNVLNPGPGTEEFNWGYAGLAPTMPEYLDNYMRPDNPFETGITEGSGGGDAFDIAWAVDDAGNPAGLSRIHFVRLCAFIAGSHGPLGAVTPEVVGIAAIARDVDTDGDGILDDYEVRAAGTDPQRRENTVLPLERPLEWGGSPAGTLLGRAEDAQGNAIAFYSSGLRKGKRAYNCAVDIQIPPEIPAASLPDGLLASGCARLFTASEEDFTAAQIQTAEFTLAYDAAQIAGLDEGRLEALRFDGTSFSRTGIENITRDPEENLLSFRCSRPGLFLLASEPGIGDTSPGRVTIPLTAEPVDGVIADGSAVIVVRSDSFLLADGSSPDPAALYTLALFPEHLASVVNEDLDPDTAGIQLLANSGIITASLRAGTQAGSLTVMLALSDGTASGRLIVPLRAGTAAAPVTLEPLNPRATAPGPIHFTSDPVTDQFGNPVTDGTLLTLEVIGGRCITPDVSSAQPGHQVTVTQHRLSFSILAEAEDGKADTVAVYLKLYADPGKTVLIGSSFHVFDVVTMPLQKAFYPALLLLLFAGIFKAPVRRRRRLPGRK
ncbi:MAG: hypothetical protein BWY07_02066 [Candidatus Hydrogenedentes bacterium ADurb.Bin170]|nr:MAG: hypothetical protein BWY07_02066 [Candidatus Hydrogenedentes bacterium ADurb.Bin170]